MKKLFIICGLIWGVALSQTTTYSSYYKQICSYDEATNDYTNCVKLMEYNLFTISKDNKVINHKEDEFKFVYEVEEYTLDSLGRHNFIVTDQKKIEQVYMFDEHKKIITALIKNKETNAIITYSVQSIY